MNNLKKNHDCMEKKIILLSVLVLFFGGLVGQERGPRFSKDDVINKKWTFVIEKSRLSDADIQKVEPVFMETELELWDLLEKYRDVFRDNRRKSEISGTNYEAINDAMVNFELDNARIQQKYYIKLKKILPAQTINRLLLAEKSYKRELMQKVPGQHRGPKQQQ
jgi:hypothetical protein